MAQIERAMRALLDAANSLAGGSRGGILKGDTTLSRVGPMVINPSAVLCETKQERRDKTQGARDNGTAALRPREKHAALSGRVHLPAEKPSRKKKEVGNYGAPNNKTNCWRAESCLRDFIVSRSTIATDYRR